MEANWSAKQQGGLYILQQPNSSPSPPYILHVIESKMCSYNACSASSQDSLF